VIARNFIQANSGRLFSLRVSVQQDSSREKMRLLSARDILEGCKRQKSRLTKLEMAHGYTVRGELDTKSSEVMMRLESLKLAHMLFTKDDDQDSLLEHKPQWPQQLTGCNIQHLILQDIEAKRRRCIPTPGVLPTGPIA